MDGVQRHGPYIFLSLFPTVGMDTGYVCGSWHTPNFAHGFWKGGRMESDGWMGLAIWLGLVYIFSGTSYHLSLFNTGPLSLLYWLKSHLEVFEAAEF